MKTVFVAGSITIKHLHPLFVERISNIVTSQFDVVVGDAEGADTAIQRALLEQGADKVIVYCSGPAARNNLGGWPVHSVSSGAPPGSRAFFTAKDVAMADAADYGLMMWDAKSTGTLSNVIELVRGDKKCVVFVNKEKSFLTVSDADSLERLVGVMSDSARAKADEKIGLLAKVRAVRQHQFGLGL